jgi:hypothetical protein
MYYLCNDIFCSSDYTEARFNYDFERLRKEAVVASLRHYRGIYLERLEKTSKT